MLLGDLLAYIDIFSVLFLLGILSRAATILFITRQVAASVGRLAGSMMTKAQRPDFRQRREHRTKGRKPQRGWSPNDDDDPAILGGVAWA